MHYSKDITKHYQTLQQGHYAFLDLGCTLEYYKLLHRLMRIAGGRRRRIRKEQQALLVLNDSIDIVGLSLDGLGSCQKFAHFNSHSVEGDAERCH